jgi:hypothetical protein
VNSRLAALSGEEGAEAPTASLEFTRPTASLVGSRVLVRVRCGGSAQEPCVGTLAVKAACGSHKLPYSIDYGEEQIVPVPVGSDGQAIGRLKSVRAVARTLQSSGASLATGERLRIR